jgi:hypothetical protein
MDLRAGADFGASHLTGLVFPVRSAVHATIRVEGQGCCLLSVLHNSPQILHTIEAKMSLRSSYAHLCQKKEPSHEKVFAFCPCRRRSCVPCAHCYGISNYAVAVADTSCRLRLSNYAVAVADTSCRLRLSNYAVAVADTSCKSGIVVSGIPLSLGSKNGENRASEVK